MDARIVKIYNADYMRISENANSIYVTIDQAEKLWQDIMVKCEEFRRAAKQNEIDAKTAPRQ